MSKSKRKRQVSDSETDEESSSGERKMETDTDEYETDSDYETPSDTEPSETDSDDDDDGPISRTPRINMARLEQVERQERDTANRLEQLTNRETSDRLDRVEGILAYASADEKKQQQDTLSENKLVEPSQSAVVVEEVKQLSLDEQEETKIEAIVPCPEPVPIVVPEDVFAEMKDDMWRLAKRDTGLLKSWIIEPKLSSEAEQRLLCPICQEIVWDPFRFNGCGHLLCRCCAEQVETRHVKGASYVCPKCKSPTNSGPTEVKDVIVRSLFAELRIKCPGISLCEAERNESFCKLEMSYWDAFGHLKKCPYETVTCVCGERMRRGRKAKHEKEVCLFRKIDCEYCKENMSAYDYDDHKFNECVAAPHASIWCKVCKVHVKDGQFIKHISDDMIKHARYMSGKDTTSAGRVDSTKLVPVNGKDEKKTTVSMSSTSKDIKSKTVNAPKTKTSSTSASLTSETFSDPTLDTENMSRVELARAIMTTEFFRNKRFHKRIQTLSAANELFIVDISDSGYNEDGTLVCSDVHMYNTEGYYRPEQWLGKTVAIDTWPMRGKVEGMAYFDAAATWMAMVRWADGDCYLHELDENECLDESNSNSTLRLVDEQEQKKPIEFVAPEPHPERLRYRHYDSRRELSEAQVRELSTAAGIKAKFKREHKQRLDSLHQMADSTRQQLFGSLGNSSENKLADSVSGSGSASGSGSGSTSNSGSGSGSSLDVEQARKTESKKTDTRSRSESRSKTKTKKQAHATRDKKEAARDRECSNCQFLIREFLIDTDIPNQYFCDQDCVDMYKTLRDFKPSTTKSDVKNKKDEKKKNGIKSDKPDVKSKKTKTNKTKNKNTEHNSDKKDKKQKDKAKAKDVKSKHKKDRKDREHDEDSDTDISEHRRFKKKRKTS